MLVSSSLVESGCGLAAGIDETENHREYEQSEQNPEPEPNPVDFRHWCILSRDIDGTESLT
jgi:hypothetical protein